MRDFDQVVTADKNTNTQILISPDIPMYSVNDYDLYDEKDRKKYIEDVKRDVRSSYEYHAMVAFLKENMDMRRCSFLENVENYGNGCKVRIELHHHPFTIDDIIHIVLEKRIQMHEAIDVELTSKEVMYLHYNLMVGLIPLSQTAHEAVHNNYIFIPNEKVYGNYKKFVNLYYNFIDPELLDKFDRLEEIGDQDNTAHYTVFEQNRIYIVPEGEYKQPDLKELQNTLQTRLDNLRNEDTKVIINPFIHLE